MDDATPGTIRARRNAAGVTIRQLETLTGINRGRLSILERGVPPTADESQVIDQVLTIIERAQARRDRAMVTA